MTRLDSSTSTRDNSTTIALIGEAIKDLELNKEEEQFKFKDIADEHGVERSTLGRR
jgi:hypothetical protein